MIGGRQNACQYVGGGGKKFIEIQSGTGEDNQIFARASFRGDIRRVRMWLNEFGAINGKDRIRCALFGQASEVVHAIDIQCAQGELMRVFIAINIPEFVHDALVELQHVSQVGKLVSPENFHLTLVFMDEQPDELIENAHHSFQHLRLPKFEVNLEGLDTFGGKAPKILYVGIEKNEALDLLQEKVIGVLRGAGVLLDRTRFRPHVTIARFGRRLSRADLDRLRDFMSGYADFGPVSFTVDSFSLYRSTLSRKGAIHDELAQYNLTSPPVNV